MKISRLFTSPDISPFDDCSYRKIEVRVRDLNGEEIAGFDDVEIPEFWSDNAGEILASKYFRKAGVPTELKKVKEKGVPEWLQRSEAVGKETTRENNVRQLISRLAGCWTYHLFVKKYFSTNEDARTFYDEMCYMMLHQYGAPNSPQWFNTGLHWAYGIAGSPQGHWRCKHEDGKVVKSDNAYEYCQPHACFILDPQDKLVGHQGIMETWKTEALIFKHGSGSGANFSLWRAANEALSSGGRSSGVMSWLKIGDVSAGAIKSGGATRRAATMRVMNIDHPDVVDFITWKSREEQKAHWLFQGAKGELDLDFNGEIYQTISGQNSNNSVRLMNGFMDAYFDDDVWKTTWRTTKSDTLKDGRKAPSYKARELMRKIATAAWQCADPGVQFHDIVNDWHTIPEEGAIWASNPCSEYMSINNSACNLASLNLVKFSKNYRKFDFKEYEHATKLWTLVLEASIVMAQLPTKEIAINTWNTRNLGLGYANLGALLMRWGIPYDSGRAEVVTGALTAIMGGYAYSMSASIAKEIGPFEAYERNKEHMLRVISNHRSAAHQTSKYDGLAVNPTALDHDKMKKMHVKGEDDFDLLSEAAKKAWDEAFSLGKKHGFRNSQTTLLAPTGTISFVMDCDTTGIEPDFALIKHKKLAGGGSMILINQSVPIALENLGYSDGQIKEIVNYIVGTRSIENSPIINSKVLREKGFHDEAIEKIQGNLKKSWHIKDAFTPANLGRSICASLDFLNLETDVLKQLGFTNKQVKEANDHVCGIGTIENAPFIQEEHLSIFTCSIKPTRGEKVIDYMAHVRIMGAAQAFLSGAISKTINMPETSTVDEIENLYVNCYRHSIKALAIYRDNCKMSQPLNIDSKEDREEREVTEKVKIITKTVMTKESRIKPNDSCNAKRFKLSLNQMKGYMHTGEYEDGSLSEIFLSFGQRGSTFEGICNLLAKVTSMSIQYGVPILQILRQYEEQYFEPSGHHKEFGPVRSIAYLVSMYIRKHYGYPIPKFVPDSIREKIEREQEEIRFRNGDYGTEDEMQELVNEEAMLEISDKIKESETPDDENMNPTTMVTCPSCGMYVQKTTACFNCPLCGHDAGCGDGAR